MRVTLQKMATLATQFVGLAEQLIRDHSDVPEVQHMQEQFRRVGGGDAPSPEVVSNALAEVDAEVLNLDEEVLEALAKGVRSIHFTHPNGNELWLGLTEEGGLHYFTEEPE